MSDLYGREQRFAQRGDTMYLSTMKRETSAERIFGRDSNFLGDIDGCRPHLHPYDFQGKPNFYSTIDIEGCAPAKSHQQKNKPPFFNTNADIEGSTPAPYSFKTDRIVNPNVPHYKLATHIPQPMVSLRL